jgi:NADH-quinone oxidoreductase subunit M
MDNHLLSLMVFLPVIGMIIITFIPGERRDAIRTVAAATTGVILALAVVLWLGFDGSTADLQFVEHYSWISSFNIEYYVGVDGISITMVLLTALLSFICIFASWGIEDRVKGYFVMFLLLELGMLGVFVSLDFFLFYIFWEVMLLPMYFLIGIWGGPRREYAAIKFFIYTLAGSVLMLVAMLALYLHADPHTFNMITLANEYNFQEADPIQIFRLSLPFAGTLYIFLFIAFAIKIPMFPFHTWLPDAHVEAPTAVSVILAGVLLKMGTYGIFRICFTLFPETTWNARGIIALFGTINIIYGALCAMAQTDLKRLVAYSSISHMGYVLLGMSAVTAAGMNGAVLQMFNHGTITAMLFLLVGVIYDRAHHREIDGFGGLAKVMPIFSVVMAFAFFASMGLPGLSGFISEMLVFIGAFPVFKTYTVIATTCVVITAAYLLWTFQRVFFGPINEKYADLPDISGRELFTLIPVGILVLILGIYPMPVLNLIGASLDNLVKIVTP